MLCFLINRFQPGKPVFGLPFLFAAVIFSGLMGNSPRTNVRQDGWQEFNLIFIDTLMTVVNRGVTRIYGEIDGRSFLLTTRLAELQRGENVYLIGLSDTTVFDIRAHVGDQGASLRLLAQGPEAATVEIFIADGFLPGAEAVDQIFQLQDTPAGFQLMTNYPNPLNNATTFRFTVPESRIFGAQVTLTIFDVLGREVLELINDRRYPGQQEVYWQPETRLPGGQYFYRVTVGEMAQIGRFVLY